MKSVVFLSLVIFFSVVPKYSHETFWRRPTLPSNPNAPIYQKLRQIPSPQKTAQSILDNFIRYQSGGFGKRQVSEEDIVIIMDESGSVGQCQFNYGRDALITSVKLSKEQEKQGKSDRTAAITFSNTATVDFGFLPPSQAIGRMKSISYAGGSTNTQAALAEALKVFNNGMRSSSELKVLLMTDGKSNVNSHLTVPNARKLKRIGVEIFVVAVGDKNMGGIPEMAKVASRPPETHVFRVDRNSDLVYVFDLALEKVSKNKYKAKKPLANPCPYSG